MTTLPKPWVNGLRLLAVVERGNFIQEGNKRQRAAQASRAIVAALDFAPRSQVLPSIQSRLGASPARRFRLVGAGRAPHAQDTFRF